MKPYMQYHAGPYRSPFQVRDPRPGTVPKMTLVNGGASVVVHFGSVVVVASLTEGKSRSTRLTLTVSNADYSPQVPPLGKHYRSRILETGRWASGMRS